MVVNISNITFGGSGTYLNPPLYCQKDLDEFKIKDIRIQSGIQVNVIYSGGNTVGIIGLDSGNNLLNQATDWIVLPCPPYCNTDCTQGTLDPINAINYL